MVGFLFFLFYWPTLIPSMLCAVCVCCLCCLFIPKEKSLTLMIPLKSILLANQFFVENIFHYLWSNQTYNILLTCIQKFLIIFLIFYHFVFFIYFWFFLLFCFLKKNCSGRWRFRHNTHSWLVMGSMECTISYAVSNTFARRCSAHSIQFQWNVTKSNQRGQICRIEGQRRIHTVLSVSRLWKILQTEIVAA